MPMPPQLRNRKRRNYKRPLFEELASLDARWLARRGMVPKDWDCRVYLNFNWLNPGFTGLIITPRVIEIFCRDGRQQIAPIHWQAIQGMCLGTIRPLFGCPRCRVSKRCAIGRSAIYLSQLQSAKGRAALQALRLRHFLNGWADQPPSKTSLMHKRTYCRLINQLRQLEARSPNQQRRTRKAKPLSHMHSAQSLCTELK